ncbi:MAG: acyltransferase family protein [Candidatus Nanopelagicales bacterium]
MSNSAFRFRTDIEGLRAVAVLLVLLFHAGVPFIPGGFVGVDVFFVVSGFLITGILVREAQKTGRISVADFYARRVRRILPMSTVVLLAILIAAVFITPTTQFDTVMTSVIAAALFVANWVFAAQSADYFAADVATNPVLHFWSLSVEEQFYVIWPILIIIILFAIRRNSALAKHRTALLAGTLATISIISLLISAFTSSASGGIAYYGLQTRLWELGVGGLLAIVAHHLTRVPAKARFLASWIGLALILYAGFAFNKDTVFPGLAALIPVGGTALILAAGITPGIPKGSASALLSVKPMQYVGARSYNLYLWHWPVLVFAGLLTTTAITDGADPIEESTVAPPVPAAIAVIIAFGLTIVTYRWIEQPLRHHKFLRTPKTALPIGAGMIAVVVLAALFVAPAAASKYSEWRGGNQTVLNDVKNLDKPQDLNEEELSKRQEACRSSQDDPAAKSIEDWNNADCIFGDPNGTKTLAVIGDSHADMWLWGLDKAGKDNGWKILMLARTNCPYMAFGSEYRSDVDISSACVEWANLAYDEVLQKYQPFDAIMLARTSRMLVRYVSPKVDDNQREELENNLEQVTAASYERFGKLTENVLVLEDPPRADFDIPTCIEKNDGDVSQCRFDRKAGLEQENELLAIEKRAAEQVQSDVRVQFVPVGELICSPSQTQCEVVTTNGKVAYRDSNHITQAAGLEYSQQIAKLISKYGRLN